MEVVVQETPSIKKHNKIYLPSKDRFKKRNKGLCGLLSLLRLAKSCRQELFHDHHLVARPRQELRTPLEGKKRERKEMIVFLMVNIGNYKESDTKVTDC